ncbi:MAG TPA: hypothetical protein VFO40_19180, partial [Chthoniobacterales bacterium]|nr:hypothetical protein [Chthoniobacterales bacterium]
RLLFVVVPDEQLRRALRFVVARTFGWTVAATAKRVTSEKIFAERNEASPIVARSRHGTVRKYQLHRKTPNAATRWRLLFVVVPDEQLRCALRFVVARTFGWRVAACTAKRVTSEKIFAERE